MDERQDTERSPNPIDLHVGAQVRLRRKVKGVSQEALAHRLGLTFQQVQKYERGANRISASKLYEIARVLETSIGSFFEGLPDTSTPPADGVEEAPSSFLHHLALKPEGAELATAFNRVKNRKIRKRVVELVKALAAEGAAASEGAVADEDEELATV